MARPFSNAIPGFSPSFFATREFILPLAAFLIAITFPYRAIFLGFIAIGQAHFLITYIYQYKGRRMRRGYLLVALGLFLAAIAYFAGGYGIVPILLFPGGLFGFHMATDEITLHGDRVRLPQILVISAFALLFLCAQLLVLYTDAPLFIPVVIFFSVILLVRVLMRTAFTTGEQYLLLLCILILIATGMFHAPGAIIGMAIILHYANWYLGYGVRVEDRPEQGRKYWFHVTWTILLSCGLMALYLIAGIKSLGFFFEPAHFYAWTTAHIVLSFVAALQRRA